LASRSFKTSISQGSSADLYGRHEVGDEPPRYGI